MVYSLTTRGLFSELSNLVMAFYYANQKGLNFIINSRYWNGKIKKGWEEYFNTLIPQIDMAAAEMSPADAQTFLTQFSYSQAQTSTEAWRRLSEYLLVKYLDGQQKKEKDGQFLRNPYGQPSSPLRPAYPEEYLRTIAPEVAHE